MQESYAKIFGEVWPSLPNQSVRTIEGGGGPVHCWGPAEKTDRNSLQFNLNVYIVLLTHFCFRFTFNVYILFC